jgi:hypothetical protein
MSAPIQPIRTVVKGNGAWVDEVWTDPISGKVVRVTAFSIDQLNAMKDQMIRQHNGNIANVDGMIALLA